MVAFLAKVKFFRFWMDYNKAFWPKSRSLFVVLLLHSGRCYEAESYSILLLLRSFYATVKLFYLNGEKSRHMPFPFLPE